MTASSRTFKEFWRGLSTLDVVSLVVALLGIATVLVGLQGGLYGFLKFLALCAGVYLLFRLIRWGRDKLLWSLRNRLIVAYLFIAVVPIVLIVIGAVYGARILYSQLGAYLLYEDIQRRTEMIRDMAEHIAAAHAVRPTGVSEEELEEVLKQQSHTVHDSDLPGLNITFSNDTSLLSKLSGPARQGFAGLVQQGDVLSLISVRAIQRSSEKKQGRGASAATGPRVVILRVPVDQEFLGSIAPDLGPIRISLMQRYSSSSRGVAYTVGDNQYQRANDIV